MLPKAQIARPSSLIPCPLRDVVMPYVLLTGGAIARLQAEFGTGMRGCCAVARGLAIDHVGGCGLQALVRALRQPRVVPAPIAW